MKGDFSRFTFDPRKHYTGVLMQQGRVQLDADWNEQVEILLDLIHQQTMDILGPAAATSRAPGFTLSLPETKEELEEHTNPKPEHHHRILPDFNIGAGYYYVDGIRCENESAILFSKQSDYPLAATFVDEPVTKNKYLVYLDVWQRDVTAVEDPAIREIALGGADTTIRVKNVWQVKLKPIYGELDNDHDDQVEEELDLAAIWDLFLYHNSHPLKLKARWDRSRNEVLENRLYRVEIHTIEGEKISFKWSRQNGSVVYPITAIKPSPIPVETSGLGGIQLTLSNLGSDPYQLQEGSWVELVDDVTLLNASPQPLCKVVDLDHANGLVTLQVEKEKDSQIFSGFGKRKGQHPLIRRWENDGKTFTRLNNDVGIQGDEWLDLENGIQVAFSEMGACQPGDYWLIPTRTRSESGIDWPQENGVPQVQDPHGIKHHFAPLGLLEFKEGRWSVRQMASTIFQTLPQISENLLFTSMEIRNISSKIWEVQKMAEELIRLSEGVSSEFNGLKEVVEKQELRIEHLSNRVKELQKEVGMTDKKRRRFLPWLHF